MAVAADQGHLIDRVEFGEASTNPGRMIRLPQLPSLQPGVRLGPYEILSAFGAGGMSEVHRTRDTRLNRYFPINILST
jgi:hypothetical protein